MTPLKGINTLIDTCLLFLIKYFWGILEGCYREQVIFGRALLTSEPDVYSKVLKDTDSFIIFGSSGFWKLITNDYAAEIVNSSPRDDIAKILAVIAIEKGARKKKTKYSNIVEIPKGEHVDGCWGVQP